jgi:predicted MPP superfamily phosphohydrolase
MDGAPEVDATLLLAHQPKSCIAAEHHGFDLQLSGHTHGGQLFPWNLFVWMAQPFSKGLHRFGRGWVYVNTGTGYWGPPMRIGVQSEITLIQLVRA